MSFRITVAATDRALLTLDECKTALGVTGNDKDLELDALRGQISDMIADECCVPAAGVTPPTLMSETIEETIDPAKWAENIALSRRWVSSITSLVEDGTTINASLYRLVDSAGGVLGRFDDDGNQICWTAAKVVVTYVAGFAVVPSALKLAAITVLREQWAASKRDPLLKRDRVDGIGEREYWVNSSSGGAASVSAISGPASAMLSRYRYYTA